MAKDQDNDRPGFILPAGLEDDEDEQGSWIPDDDGNVYLNRQAAQPQPETKRRDGSRRKNPRTGDR